MRQDAGSGEAAGSCAVTSCSVYESVMSTLSMPDGVDISLQRVSESGGDARTGEGRGGAGTYLCARSMKWWKRVSASGSSRRSSRMTSSMFMSWMFLPFFPAPPPLLAENGLILFSPSMLRK